MEPSAPSSSAGARPAPLTRPRVARRLPVWVPGILPEFLIIGAQKCGTSSLYRYLAAHPDVAFSVPKEVRFFCNHWRRGVRFYQSHFPTRLYARAVAITRGRRLVAGEATPQYLYHFRTPQRVAEVLPAGRFVVLLRNPVDRAYSHYHMHIRKRGKLDRFEDLVRPQLERLRGVQEIDLRAEWKANFSVGDTPLLAKGIYADGLANWFQHFDRSRFLILESNDLFQEPASTYERITHFLQLRRWQPPHFGRYNRGSYSEMDPGLRGEVLEFFRPHNERLFDLLGQRFEWDA